jgi:hypothetical protein
MSDDNPIKSGIKAAVDVCNAGLQKVQVATEGIRKPVQSGWKAVSEESATIGSKASYLYQRRHEFAPQLIGGSAVLSAGFMTVRRGRLAGLVGGLAGGGLAYGIVYDQFILENVPDIFFGKKE